LGEKRKMKGFKSYRLLAIIALTILLITLLPPTEASQGNSTMIEGTIEIEPGKHYFIYYDSKTHGLIAKPIPEVDLPDIAHEALERVPDWIRDKLKKAFEDLTKGDINVGAHSKCAVGDINGDGLVDILIGNEEGTLTYYENTGVSEWTQWTRKDGFFTDIYVPGFSAPALADLNDDGLLDLAVGCSDGKIYFWWNIGSKEQPVWMEAHEVFSGIDVGEHSAPTFADLNGDELLDLVVGSASGELFCYRNIGTAEEPVWKQDDRLLKVEWVGEYTVPAFADLAGDGKLYLIIGAQDGNLYVFKNVGTIHHPVWERQEMLTEVTVGGYSSPCLADIDQDRRIDLLIGSVDGYIYYIRNYGTPSLPEYPWWDSDAEETYMSTILWGPGYYPDIDRLTAVNEPNTEKYVEEYAKLILDADPLYVDEIAYCIANEQISHLKMFADKGAADIYELNARAIYEMAPNLKYVQIVEKDGYTTLSFNSASGWKEIPPEIYYQRLVMLNRYIVAPWAWPDRYEGNWYMTYLPWDTTYGVSLYDRVKDAETVTEAMWNIALWIKVDIGAWWHFGTEYWKPPGWYNIYKHLADPEWTILCGEFSIITMVAGRAVLIPVANTLNLGEDHQWDEFFNEELRWVHIDLSATAPGDVEGLRNYFDNPSIYEDGWGKDISAVMWWEQGGRYDHIIPRTRQMGYSDTALVTFTVRDKEGKPIDGARVEAWSHWIEKYYGIPLISLLNYTDLNGETSLELGKNDYTFFVITRIGYVTFTKTIEEGKTYHIDVTIDNVLPEPVGEARLVTPAWKTKYQINVEFTVLSGYQANPHWIHIVTMLFGWQDYWTFEEGIYTDVYVMSPHDYRLFISGLNFNVYDMETGASEGEILGVPIKHDAYIVISNDKALTTTLIIYYRIWITTSK